MEKFDVAIAGGGILGTSLAFWLSRLYEGRIAVLECEADVALRTSGRNTGVIHRPFYLNPERRRVFARSAQVSYGLWKRYAELRGLPWKEVRTLEVAVKQGEPAVLEKYLKWAVQNGMKESEIEPLTPAQVRALEPNVECLGAVYSKTDSAVDFAAFTRALKEDAAAAGAQFRFGFNVSGIREQSGRLTLSASNGAEPIEAGYLVNCAGGDSIDVAHLMGVGLEYTDLHFRGEYWEIGPEQANLVNRNIYSVPRHPELPFLDPHWIVRADGRREIGPNAVLVAGSRTYEGFANGIGELVGKVFERPLRNKFNLFTNPEFLKLASEEWMSSLSKNILVSRVKKFIPKLESRFLSRRGTAGVRSSVIDRGGNFMKEAIELSTPLSTHVVNYNSPGATGSPAYTALLARKLIERGALSGLKKRGNPPQDFWNFEEVVGQF